MSRLAQILKRFPEHEHAIYRIAKSNSRFHELCIAYDDCQQVIVALNENGDSNSRKREYQESAIELEVLINSYLED